MTGCAIYLRVSKRDGSQDPQNQLRELKAFCKQQRWRITEIYTDHASGGRSDRASFRRMMLDASKRKFDTILFWALDRFSREGVRATLNYLGQLEGYGVGFRSYQEPLFDSAGPFKEAMVSLFATFAKLERARISERTLAGLAKAREQGRIGGRPRVDANPATMKRLRALRKQGLSIRAVASKLKLSPGTVHKLVKL